MARWRFTTLALIVLAAGATPMAYAENPATAPAPVFAPVSAPPPAPAPAACEVVETLQKDPQIEACRAIIKTDRSKDRVAEAFATLCQLLSLNQDRDNAFAACNSAIALKPRLADAWSYRAQLFGLTYDHDRAIADFTRAIALERHPEFNLYLRAGAYNARGDFNRLFPERAAGRVADYNRAIADATRAIALLKKAPAKAHDFAMMLASFASNEIDKANAAKDKIAKGEKPADPRAWCAGNDLPLEEGPPFDRMIMACTALIHSGHESQAQLGEDYFLRGRAYDQENKTIEEQWRAPMAIPDYEKAIALGAEIADASLGIGAIYVDHGDAAHALPYLDTAVAANGPHVEQALVARGRARGMTGALDLALADLDRAVALKPDDNEALLARSAVRTLHGDYRAALSDCTAVYKRTEAWPDGANAHAACGDAHFFAKDYRAAIADFDGAVKAGNSQPDILYARGIAKLRHGDKTEAQTDIEAATKLDPAIAEKQAKLGFTP